MTVSWNAAQLTLGLRSGESAGLVTIEQKPWSRRTSRMTEYTRVRIALAAVEYLYPSTVTATDASASRSMPPPRPVAQCHSGLRSSTTCLTTSGSQSISLSEPSP